MKRIICLVLALVLILSLCACSEEEPTATTAPEKTGATEQKQETNKPAQIPDATRGDDTRKSLHIYSLNGPTTMGLAALLDQNKQGLCENFYLSTICTAADEVTSALVEGKADIALLPANAAAALYNKAGGFSVIAINTLGVLYLLENGQSVQSVADLAGKTVYLTGKGTTPEYALRYLLAANGIEDKVTLEFKSEPQEVVAAMKEQVASLGLLPQPFVTIALKQNEELRVALDLNVEWNSFAKDSQMVTGVTVVRNEILEQYPEAVDLFLKDASASVDAVNSDPAKYSQVIEDLSITKASIAEIAIPKCNLRCIVGSEMKQSLSGYLKTLYDQNPKAVGGKMPADAFYYTGE